MPPEFSTATETNRNGSGVGAVQSGLAVAEVVQRKRWALDISSRALSARAGLSEAYVKRLESGDMVPGLEAFARIAVELRLSAQEVYMIILAVARSSREKMACASD